MKNLFLTVLICLIAPINLLATEFHDALGRKLTLPHTPQRILSLVPAVTEILFALGLDNEIVAVTDYCDYPAAAQKLPKVGEYADPGLENILLFKPDLVFAAADMNRPTLVRRLETLNIPVYVVYPHTVNAALKTIRSIGDITGEPSKAQRLAASIEMRIDRIQQQLPGRKRPGVLEAVMLQPLTVAGPETFGDDIMRIAGGLNVVPTGPSRYPTWNSEALLTIDPEVIIVSTYPGQPDPEQFFARWPLLQAVKNQRIVHIEADWIHRPGPRIILGIEALAKALHPDIRIDE
ncbi:MAG: cobalamin-binding protein [Deltaproteobacteria bacterium]|nr:cobalamin-binding protein [Deltaproteobacteria bacterium]